MMFQLWCAANTVLGNRCRPCRVAQTRPGGALRGPTNWANKRRDAILSSLGSKPPTLSSSQVNSELITKWGSTDRGGINRPTPTLAPLQPSEERSLTHSLASHLPSSLCPCAVFWVDGLVFRPFEEQGGCAAKRISSTFDPSKKKGGILISGRVKSRELTEMSFCPNCEKRKAFHILLKNFEKQFTPLPNFSWSFLLQPQTIIFTGILFKAVL